MRWFNALSGWGVEVGCLPGPSFLISIAYALVTEEAAFQTPKPSQTPCVPPLVKTPLFSPKLSTPDVSSPFGTPFGSSVVNRVAGIFDVNTCSGSPQSPQLIRRGPRLWTHTSGEGRLLSRFEVA